MLQLFNIKVSERALYINIGTVQQMREKHKREREI